MVGKRHEADLNLTQFHNFHYKYGETFRRTDNSNSGESLFKEFFYSSKF